MSHSDERERERTMMGCFVPPRIPLEFTSCFLKKNAGGDITLVPSAIKADKHVARGAICHANPDRL